METNGLVNDSVLHNDGVALNGVVVDRIDGSGDNTDRLQWQWWLSPMMDVWTIRPS